MPKNENGLQMQVENLLKILKKSHKAKHSQK